jgi:hypothetical protein
LTDIEAVLKLIKDESSITDLLGKFKSGGVDTAFPMVLIGTFPEEQTNLPAISIRALNKDVQYGITTSRITVSCYAETENESMNVANAVNDLFRDAQGGVSGFSARFESSITGTVNDADQSGSIVELKLEYR